MSKWFQDQFLQILLLQLYDDDFFENENVRRNVSDGSMLPNARTSYYLVLPAIVDYVYLLTLKLLFVMKTNKLRKW